MQPRRLTCVSPHDAIPLPTCCRCRQNGGLLGERDLVALLAEVVPQGQVNARMLTHEDYDAFEVGRPGSAPRARLPGMLARACGWPLRWLGAGRQAPDTPELGRRPHSSIAGREGLARRHSCERPCAGRCLSVGCRAGPLSLLRPLRVALPGWSLA